MYFGAALTPDSNIGSASEERIIHILGLPFRRDAEELTTSGIGLSVWTGGEYHYPLRDRVRLRAGADLSRREYAGLGVRPDQPLGARRPALAHQRRDEHERACDRPAPPGHRQRRL